MFPRCSWSFGVLMWETVTFGAKPYSDVVPEDLPALLTGGHRLPQPEGVEDEM